jgi:bifunctional oligoribonuclease and PAP phosphatase NrnA
LGLRVIIILVSVIWAPSFYFIKFLNLKNIPLELFSELKLLLSGTKKAIIITHVNPDGDAIGSALGLYIYLSKKGIETSVITPNKDPEFLQWLPKNKDIIVFTEQKNRAMKAIGEAEVVFTLDFNVMNRAGEAEQCIKESKAKKVLIDHHPYPESFPDIAISDISVSSTSELVYEVILQLGDKELVDKSIAECLYTGIMTDTGNFSYNSSEIRTYNVVADLLSQKINKNEIYSFVFDNFSADRMRLLGYCLNDKMLVLPEYHAAIISISLEEQKRFNFATGDSEGFVNYPLSIKGVIFSVLLIEKKDRVRLSFRSKGNFAVNKVAEQYFEGGGHHNAAGGDSKLSFEATLQKLMEIIPLYETELNL